MAWRSVLFKNVTLKAEEVNLSVRGLGGAQRNAFVQRWTSDEAAQTCFLFVPWRDSEPLSWTWSLFCHKPNSMKTHRNGKSYEGVVTIVDGVNAWFTNTDPYFVKKHEKNSVAKNRISLSFIELTEIRGENDYAADLLSFFQQVPKAGCVTNRPPPEEGTRSIQAAPAGDWGAVP